MYLDFYKLREFPFAITCDERFFYESPVHIEALANMMYTVQQRKGMVLITGEVGAGKTFVGNMLGSRLGMSCMTVAIKSPPGSGKQLLRTLARRMGLSVAPNADKGLLTEELEQQFARLHSHGRLVALIMDESQDLTPPCLEEIRLLWNWELAGQRLVQIILIGQPELRDKLREPQWEPLRQRIVLSYHLGHLGAQDTAKYVRHRVNVAAAEGGSIAQFTESALRDIHVATCGTPRMINVLCDNALLVGYAKGSHVIDSPIISEVLRDMTCWGMASPSQGPMSEGGVSLS